MQKIDFNLTNFELITKTLLNGGICVLPTDTLYGISASAIKKDAVENIYKIKQRDNNKPYIILVSKIAEIKKLGIQIDKKNEEFLTNNWPAPLSVIFDCYNNNLEYLHRGTNSLAFRIPKFPELLKLLELVGPITSTTVNLSNEVPVENIAEAMNIFGDKIDLYVDLRKNLSSPPSTVIKLNNGNFEIIRQGEYKIKYDSH